MPQNSPHVLVLAYSGRALAEAAKAAGLRTTVLDQFGDADTLLAADLHVPTDFSSDFNSPAGRPFQAIRALATKTVRPTDVEIGFERTACTANPSSPPATVLLGGGCENRPKLIKQLNLLAADSSLEGVPAESAVKKLRAVEFWKRASTFAGCQAPPTRQASSDNITHPTWFANGQWLVKQADSAGGLGICPLSKLDPAAFQLAPGSYLQKRIPGRSLGISILVGEHETRVLGCTESISSQDWQPPQESKADPTTRPSQFIYRGSWGPIRLPECHHVTLVRIGDFCREQTGWRGWLQIDFIEDTKGQLWMLEMNPRWTAGMEVLRLSGVCNPVQEHLRALRVPLPTTPAANIDRLVAKAVYYAEHDTAADRINQAAHEAEREMAAINNSSERIFRDVPSQGSASVLAGHPALTIVVSLPQPKNTPVDIQRQSLLGALRHARQALESKLARLNR